MSRPGTCSTPTAPSTSSSAGADSHVHELWWDHHGWHTHDLTTITGAPSATGDPAGYLLDGEDSQHVVFNGTDHHIHELRLDASAWHTHDLSAITGAPAAASDPAGYGFTAENSQHVVFRGADNHLRELRWG